MKDLTDIGFFHTETGGGCTAYQMNTAGNGHLLITVVGDSEAPKQMTDKIVVSLYNDKGDPDVTLAHGITVSEFIAQQEAGYRGLGKKLYAKINDDKIKQAIDLIVEVENNEPHSELRRAMYCLQTWL